MAGFFNPDALNEDPELCDMADYPYWAWIMLCIGKRPRCGILKINMRGWAMNSRVPLEQLPACLDEYEKLGWIERDPKSGYVWIRNYTAHQSKSREWRKAAYDEALQLRDKTELAQKWLDYYAELTAESNLKSNLKSALKSGPTGQDSTGQDKKTTPRKPKIPAKETADALTGAAEALGKAKPENIAAPSKEAMAVADYYEKLIQQAIDRGMDVGKNWRRQPFQIARAIDSVKVDKVALLDALQWGMEEDAFYQSELMNQAAWAKEPNRWVALLNKYRARGPRRPGPQKLAYARERG